MKRRCLNPNSTDWPRYGGRGITIAPEWRDDFAAFFKHIGPKPSPSHSIDRVDNNGNYEPGNVRWALPEVQRINRERGVRLIAFGGRTLSLRQWAKEIGVHESTLHERLAKGWPLGRAFGPKLTTWTRQKA